MTDSNGIEIDDDNGNPTFVSRRREPGKVNLNTVGEYAWAGISPSDQSGSGLYNLGTSWKEFDASRYPSFKDEDTGNSTGSATSTITNKGFCYFQPSHTLGLWVQLDGSPAPVPTYTSLLTQQTFELSKDDSEAGESLLDNVGSVFNYDSDNNSVEKLYEYKLKPEEGAEASNDWIEGTWSDIQTAQENGNLEDYRSKTSSSSKPNNLFEATAEMQRLSGVTTNRSNTFAVWVTVGYFEVERCNPGVNMPDVDPDGNTLTFNRLKDPTDKWYYYYQAIYPDCYTYGKELGSEYGETERHRGFSIIDRSIPVDYRRGNSRNWSKTVLSKNIID